MFDFHTHRLDTPPGSGIVCLPQPILLRQTSWRPHQAGLYAAGIHPWWTAAPDFDLPLHLSALEHWLSQPQVVQLGECGLDRIRGAEMERQIDIFEQQVRLSEDFQKGMTLHIVRAFDLLLQLHKRLRPQQRWTVHGFRGGETLARQLLSAGLDLSFGTHYNEAAFQATPLERRHRETDAG